MLYDSAGKLTEKKLTLICHCITATLCTGAMINGRNYWYVLKLYINIVSSMRLRWVKVI